MSTTFQVQAETLGWAIECYANESGTGEVIGEHFAKYADFVDARDLHMLSCEDCSTGCYAHQLTDLADAPEVNMHNRGSEKVLRALGYSGAFEDTSFGYADGREFLGRILIALGLAPHDEGTPSYDLQPGEFSGSAFIGFASESGPTINIGAVPEGDLQARLNNLRAVAQCAVDNGREVIWS